MKYLNDSKDKQQTKKVKLKPILVEYECCF